MSQESEVYPSSGNIFADLGLADSEELIYHCIQSQSPLH